MELFPRAVEDFPGSVVKQHEVYGFEGTFVAQMFRGFAQHDFCAFFQRKSGHARAHGGKGDGFQAAILGNSQAMRGGTPQRLGGRRSTQAHAGRVDYEARFQFSARGNRRVPYGYRADFVALALDGVAAFSPDGAGHASAQN